MSGKFLFRVALRALGALAVGAVVAATSASAQSCVTRTFARCAQDASCEPHFGPSNCDPGPGPCLPDHVYKRCVPFSPERRQLRARYRAQCLDTGGTLVAMVSGAPRGSRAACVCDKPVNPVAAHRLAGNAPAKWPRQFVDGRGCIDEQLLCREHSGRWIDAADIVRSQSGYCASVGAAPWQPEDDPIVSCLLPGATERLRESACRKIAGARAQAPSEPIGHCTVPKGAIAAPENLRPYCEIDGRAARWDALGVGAVEPP